MECSGTRTWQVWISEAEKIISFHPVKGYCRMWGSKQEPFFKRLMDLASQGYRIQ